MFWSDELVHDVFQVQHKYTSNKPLSVHFKLRSLIAKYGDMVLGRIANVLCSLYNLKTSCV